MKEVYNLLDYHKLVFLIDNNTRFDPKKFPKEIFHSRIASDILHLITDKKNISMLDSIKTIKKFFAIVSEKWEDANTLLLEMTGGKESKNTIGTNNIYLDIIRQLTETFNINPQLLNFDEGVYFLYRYNNAMEAERKRAERDK